MCRAARASIFCVADNARLCPRCDEDVHAVNELAARHVRSWLCDMCASGPATTCLPDYRMALCNVCDGHVAAMPQEMHRARLPNGGFVPSKPFVPQHARAAQPPAAAQQQQQPAAQQSPPPLTAQQQQQPAAQAQQRKEGEGESQQRQQRQRQQEERKPLANKGNANTAPSSSSDASAQAPRPRAQASPAFPA